MKKFASNNIIIKLPIVLIIVLSSIFISFGQVNSINISFDKDTALIGDYLKLKLESTYKNGEVFFPILKDSLRNGFEVIEKSNEQIIDTLNQKYKTQEYIITQFDAGNYQFAPMQFLYKTNTNSIDTLYSNSFGVCILTVAIDTLIDIKPIKSVIFPPFELKEFIPLIIGCIVLLTLIIFAIIWWRRRQKNTPQKIVLTPEDIFEYTLKELELLKTKKLWIEEDISSLKTKEHHLKLSDLLKGYLEVRFEILAMESTTNEIIQNLEKKKSIKSDSINLLEEILKHSDLVKFAKWKPNNDSCEKIMNDSILFVKQTKPLVLNTVEKNK
jgi:hypothetical protein